MGAAGFLGTFSPRGSTRIPGWPARTTVRRPTGSARRRAGKRCVWRGRTFAFFRSDRPTKNGVALHLPLCFRSPVGQSGFVAGSRRGSGSKRRERRSATSASCRLLLPASDEWRSGLCRWRRFGPLGFPTGSFSLLVGPRRVAWGYLTEEGWRVGPRFRILLTRWLGQFGGDSREVQTVVVDPHFAPFYPFGSPALPHFFHASCFLFRLPIRLFLYPS